MSRRGDADAQGRQEDDWWRQLYDEEAAASRGGGGVGGDSLDAHFASAVDAMSPPPPPRADTMRLRRPTPPPPPPSWPRPTRSAPMPPAATPLPRGGFDEPSDAGTGDAAVERGGPDAGPLPAGDQGPGRASGVPGGGGWDPWVAAPTFGRRPTEPEEPPEEAVRPESVPPEPVRPEPVRPEPVRPEPAQPLPAAQPEPEEGESAAEQAEPVVPELPWDPWAAAPIFAGEQAARQAESGEGREAEVSGGGSGEDAGRSAADAAYEPPPARPWDDWVTPRTGTAAPSGPSAPTAPPSAETWHTPLDPYVPEPGRGPEPSPDPSPEPAAPDGPDGPLDARDDEAAGRGGALPPGPGASAAGTPFQQVPPTPFSRPATGRPGHARPASPVPSPSPAPPPDEPANDAQPTPVRPDPVPPPTTQPPGPNDPAPGPDWWAAPRDAAPDPREPAAAREPATPPQPSAGETAFGEGRLRWAPELPPGWVAAVDAEDVGAPEVVGGGPPTYGAEPSAWPEADPDAMDALVADTVLDGAQYGRMTLRSVAMRGDSARYRGQPRRDALLTARFGTGDDALLLLALASGARAADDAHRAAQDAVRWIAGAVGRSRARLADDMRAARKGALKSGLHRLTDRCYGRLRARGEDLGLDEETYTASLRCMLLPADPESRIRLFFGVGDGGLFRIRDGAWQDLDLAPDEATAPFRFHATVARPGDALLMCSAGLAEPLRGEPELAAYLAGRWGGGQVPGLAAYLADAQTRVKGYADDRTAVTVWDS